MSKPAPALLSSILSYTLIAGMCPAAAFAEMTNEVQQPAIEEAVKTGDAATIEEAVKTGDAATIEEGPPKTQPKSSLKKTPSNSKSLQAMLLKRQAMKRLPTKASQRAMAPNRPQKP